MIVHTLLGAQPPSRTDGISWTQVRIEEALSAEGDYTALETQSLSADDDPRHPAIRDLTFSGNLPAGYFRLVFIDAEENESAPTDPVFDDGTAIESVGWRPSVRDVGRRLRARTKDEMGNELGTFTTATRPNADQVEGEISVAVGEITSRVGLNFGGFEHLEQRARSLTSLYAAMLIELSYFPEQVGSTRSPYDKYKDLYDEGIKAFIESVAEHIGGGDGESIGGIGPLPSSGFPEASGIAERAW